MKNARRPIAALLSALLALFVFAGCDQALTPEQMITRSLDTMNGLKSYEVKLTMDVSVQALGADVKTQVSNQSTVFLSPYRSAAVTYVSMGENTTQVQSFTQDIDGKLIQHAFANDTWMHEEVKLDSIDASSQMKIYLESASSFEAVGEEKISLSVVEDEVETGKVEFDTMHVKGKLSGEALSTAIRTQLEAMGMPLDATGDLGAMDVDMWIEKGTNRPVRMRMDMSDIIQRVVLGGAGDGMSLSAVMEMTMFNFDKASEFEVPAEALTDYQKQR